MIWHFLEVWFLLLIAFVVGCVLGAWLYGLMAESRLALVQGAVADQVGDILDRVKASLGMSPDWRPEVGRAVERAQPAQTPQPPPAETTSAETAAIEEIEEAEFEEEAVLEAVEPAPTYVEVAPPPVRPRLQPPAPAPSPPRSEEPAVAAEGEAERVAFTGEVGDDGVVPMRPAGLSRPRGGVPDNLTRIRGIGERNEARLNSLGIFHFGQIAAWTPGEVRWIGQYLAFPERIERDDWVGQAMILASGGDTGFEKSADRRRRRRRERQQGADTEQLAADVEAVMGRRRVRPPTPDDPDGDED